MTGGVRGAVKTLQRVRSVVRARRPHAHPFLALAALASTSGDGNRQDRRRLASIIQSTVHFYRRRLRTCPGADYCFISAATTCLRLCRDRSEEHTSELQSRQY